MVSINSKLKKVAVGCVALSMTACIPGANIPNSEWYKAGEAYIKNAFLSKWLPQKNQAKNVILFVGDGMGISTVTAARILEGQMRGESGEENLLSFEQFPYVGLAKTYNSNQQTPDSAGTMTAMMTGVKTRAGVLNIDETAERANCAQSQGKELTTALELAESKGLATGIVSTARITHATPAAAFAKSPERNWESNDGIPEAEAALGCKDIAYQLINFNAGDGIDVAFGGGRRHFLPNTVTDSEGKKGKRTDNLNLVDTWKANNPQGTYVENQAQFDNINLNAKKLFGLFNSSHMNYEADRKNDIAGEPSLSEMTEKAVKFLSKNDNGFLLVVEAGRIDHAHHAGSAFGALTDAIELSKAVEKAKALVGDDTLIITTADHSHVFTIAGYPTRGNPILGKVISNDGAGNAKTSPSLAQDQLPYTTVGYTNGLGFADLGDETDADARYGLAADAGRKDISAVDTQAPGYHQEALVPLGSETHAGEDVGIYSTGPSAYLLSGVVEQNVIFHAINHAMKLQ